jgi:hypothetical protein
MPEMWKFWLVAPGLVGLALGLLWVVVRPIIRDWKC